MKQGKPPTPEALRAFREERGWTQEQLAEAVGALPLEVSGWEAGTMTVPIEQARVVRGLAAQEKREAALGALAPCDRARVEAPGLGELLRSLPLPTEFSPADRRHLKECAACRGTLRRARKLRDVPIDPGLGSEPSQWMPLMLIAGIMGIFVAAQYAFESTTIVDVAAVPDVTWPMLMAVLAFHWTDKLLFPGTGESHYVSSRLRLATAAAAGLLAWSYEQASDQTPVMLAILAFAALALWVARRYAEPGEDASDNSEPLAESATGAAADGAPAPPLLTDAAPGLVADQPPAHGTPLHQPVR